MKGAISITITVEGDVRAAYDVVRRRLDTEELPEGDALEGRPFVVRLSNIVLLEYEK